MRSWFLALVVVAAWCGIAVAQEDKKTDDDKPADPDTGESTVQEKTLGLLPNPLQKYGIKFAATYIGEKWISAVRLPAPASPGTPAQGAAASSGLGSLSRSHGEQ